MGCSGTKDSKPCGAAKPCVAGGTAPGEPNLVPMATWSWKGSHRWNLYDDEISRTLESAYQANKSSTTISLGSVKYIIDFKNMHQVNAHDPTKTRQIRRQGDDSRRTSTASPSNQLGFSNSQAGSYMASDADPMFR
mmetsp:Transcript_24094/g.29449  ORF Transcript_24094/g.29449 Transcript_24094/m.29449 type:complete len:136 (-) Transcript_24094:118-525(-)